MTYKITQNDTTIFEVTVEHITGCTDYKWDSRTGLITAKDTDGKRVIVPYTGKAMGTVDPSKGPFKIENCIQARYHYWYY